MGLETGTWITDLVTTNPPSGDDVSQGDDHIRLLKTTVKNSFPSASKAWYNPTSTAKSANYTVLATDMNNELVVDATGAARTITLPTLAAGDAGWAIGIVKSDASANAVIVAGTINGEVNFSLVARYQRILCVWSGSAWYGYHSMKIVAGVPTLPSLGVTANATVGGTLGVTGAATLSSTLNVVGNFSVNTNKFTSNATSGDAAVAGALTVAGDLVATTLLKVTEQATPASPAAGKVSIYAKTDKFVYAKNSAGSEFPLGGLSQLFIAQNQQVSGTAGGSATSGSWNALTGLNTIVANGISGASMPGYQPSLPAGTYYARWSSPFNDTLWSQTRLYNASDAAVIGYGGSVYAESNYANTAISHGEAYFTLAAAKAIELQYRVNTTHASNGLGFATSFAGTTEVYTQLSIWKIG